jgi:prepilin-type N-terminal cleavage/methylation domain-containing protein
MKNIRFLQSRQAFTLVEIMVVVLIVGILSAVAIAVVSRVKTRTVDSLIRSNLRQLYQAQEFFYSEGSRTDRISSFHTLGNEGYLTKSMVVHLKDGHTMEANAGWHYFMLLRAGQPVAAYKGPAVMGHGIPTGEIIYYPGPPESVRAFWIPVVPQPPRP